MLAALMALAHQRKDRGGDLPAEEPGPESTPPEALARETDSGAAAPLGPATLASTYIPDFPFEEIQFWFAPSRAQPETVYHEFLGRSADKWDFYYNKKGWRFVHHSDPGQRRAEGPFRPAPGELRLRMLESGRFFSPRPKLELKEGGLSLPIVSIEKRRPLNPWKPNYIKALNFIKQYEWPRELAQKLQVAVWEIEECGEVAGSTSWQNAEMLLTDSISPDLLFTFCDLFEKRPEEFPLGSEVYLRILGRSGGEGFKMLCELHSQAIAKKRKHVARTLGELGRAEGLEPLFLLLDDEDPEVRNAALRAIGRVGVPAADPRAESLRSRLESESLPHRVWAAEALLKGGDESQKKFLINLVKEQEGLPLSDMGELGGVLAELKIVEAVPFLINRLKSDNSEIRVDAAEALRGVTGLHLEVVQGDEESRRRAIRAYSRWWEDSKKERRRTGDGKG